VIRHRAAIPATRSYEAGADTLKGIDAAPVDAVEKIAMTPTARPAQCAVCHRPDAEWLSCSLPMCDPAEATTWPPRRGQAIGLGAQAAVLQQIASAMVFPLGARCMVRIGREHIEGVITAKLTLASGEQGAYVQLDGHGDMVALPLADVQVIR
jgi:hypothetical protein